MTHTTMPGAADLVGRWTLAAWTISFSDGRPDTHPYGENPVGLLIYLADGRMSVTVSRADRARLSDENPRKAPEAEKAAAFDSFFHYAGRWSLAGETVTHHVEVALNPNFIGSDQIRKVAYTGNSLTLSLESQSPSGATVRNALVWQRDAG